MSFTVQKKLKRKLKGFLIVLFSFYIMIGSALYFFQEKILFLPTTLEQDYKYESDYQFEELFLKTDADATINALHYKVENPNGVILYFHGNAGDLSRWGNIAEYFVAQQYDVLVMDYRTYGKSTGTLSEEGFYKDAQYCYNYLLKQYLETEIILYGRSLGTGIASYLAAENNPKQLILETPYYSILDVAESRFPMFPLEKLLKYNFSTFQFLPKTSCPITIIHGTDDRIVPYASSRKLFDLNLVNIKFVTIEGGHHNNLIEFDAYHKAINALL
jgi:pimeloyl-ACP methyl ester carboxylesterase